MRCVARVNYLLQINSRVCDAIFAIVLGVFAYDIVSGHPNCTNPHVPSGRQSGGLIVQLVICPVN